jgi:hypothetical protein
MLQIAVTGRGRAAELDGSTISVVNEIAITIFKTTTTTVITRHNPSSAPSRSQRQAPGRRPK